VKVLKAGLIYFALVFGAGFVLGPVRVLYLVPRVGARAAELIEMPVMLAVAIVAARRVVSRLAVPSNTSIRLAMGGVALGMLLAAEFALVRPLRGLSMAEYLATRDPVSGTVYAAMLVLVAVMPRLVAYTRRPSDGFRG
jgi:hypothetical protein